MNGNTADRPSVLAAGRHGEQMADSLRSREARLHINPTDGFKRNPSPPAPPNDVWCFSIKKKCIVCEVDQDAASQNAALLKNSLSLRGKEKPNRMFIFCKVKKKKKKASLQG